MGILGDILYRGSSVWQTLTGNTTATKKFFTQLGTGTLSAAPVWSTIVNADLPNSGVTANTYGSSTTVPVITVNVKGIITSVVSTTITSTTGFVTTGVTLTNNQIIVGAGTNGIKVSDLTGDITTSGGVATTLSTTGVTASTYGSSTAIPIVTVDAKGRITAASTTTFSVGSGTVTTTGTPTSGNLVKFSGSTSITNTDLSGDITTSGASTTSLSTTGVTAASYGSSSAIPVITVDAKGRITAASTTTISTTSGAVVALASTTLASSTTSVAFSSISGSYTHLFVIAKGRLTEAVTDNYLKMQFNGDTGANYDHQQFFGAGTSTSAAAVYATTNGGRVADWTAASASTTLQAGQCRIEIPFYTENSFGKEATSVMGSVFGTTGSNMTAGVFNMYWRNTSTITSITFVGANSNIAANSRFTLYGMS